MENQKENIRKKRLKKKRNVKKQKFTNNKLNQRDYIFFDEQWNIPD